MSSDDYGSEGGFSAECVDEYSVDSDGNIKPGQDAPILPKSGIEGKDNKKEEGDKPELSLEERRKVKALAKLDKRIKAVTKTHDKTKKIKVEP